MKMLLQSVTFISKNRNEQKHDKMTMQKNHFSAFQAKVAIKAIRGEQALAELAQYFDVYYQPDRLLEKATS